MKLPIETSVYGRDDKKLEEYNTTMLIFFLLTGLFLFLFLLHQYKDVVISLFAFLILLMSYSILKRPIINRKFFKEKPVWKYVIRKVTTDLGKDYYSVFEEAYDGRFSQYSHLQKKFTQGYWIYLFKITDDQIEVDDYVRQLNKQKEQDILDNQTIVKIHV